MLACVKKWRTYGHSQDWLQKARMAMMTEQHRSDLRCMDIAIEDGAQEAYLYPVCAFVMKVSVSGCPAKD
jgi:alanine-alpha-ketoisovalerate/valine-pyruvate aminotransferase